MMVTDTFKIGLGCAAFAAAVIAALGTAEAQTASQLVSPTYAPPVVRAVEGGLSLNGATGLEAPKGADALQVTPSGLLVEGGRAELASETSKIEESLKGKRVTGADLFASARALEEAYARAGYLLVRVSLPPQTIRDGNPLRLVVTDGRVESIDASAMPERVRGRISAMLAPLVGKSGVTRSELERRLLLAGDIPGLMLRSTLRAGSESGGTVIVIDGRYDAVTASITADNSLSDNLGIYSGGLAIDFNAMLGLGEVGYLRLNGYPGFVDNIFETDPRNRQIIAGFTLPLGTDGMWLAMEGIDSRTNPKSDLSYAIEGHYQRLSTRFGYTWIRSRSLNTSSVLSFNISKETQRINLNNAVSPFTEDQLRVLRLTQSGDLITDWGGQFTGSATLSLGLDGLGAREGTTVLPLSRQGANPDFQKLEISANYGQSFLDEQTYVSIAGKAQTSFQQALVSSEQFGLGGFDWLSAFDGGKIQGDAGAAFRAELSFPQTLPDVLGLGDAFGGAVAPYAFGAAGMVRLEQPTAVERSSTRALAVGGGIRLGLSQKASPNSASLMLEYAHGAASDQTRSNRFNMRFLARF